jgi:hypothetical protein
MHPIEMNPAPVALFIYNRPEHTSRTLEALQQNTLSEKTTLFVFADGPKENATQEEADNIHRARAIASSATGMAAVHLIFSSHNMGLSQSIINGINHVLEKYDSVIVLEDDIVTHPDFLEFCNQALTTYATDENVYAVSGFSFPLRGKLPPAYFLRTGAVWGWGCWKRSWKHITMDSGKLLSQIEAAGRIKEFNFDDNYDFYDMLKRHHAGLISSWDVCWYGSIFVRNGLTYFPSCSLTINIGMDGSGTHYSGITSDPVHAAFDIPVEEIRELMNYHPAEIAIEPEVQKAITRYFFSYQKGGVINRVKHILKKFSKIKM